jgi:chromosome transmission fidelity protein 8
MIIEMQGSFDINNEISGQKVGNFMWNDTRTASLMIGHQLFEGKIVELEKPFLLINKSGTRDTRFAETKECIIEAIVKRKILFKTRPKSIITRMS